MRANQESLQREVRVSQNVCRFLDASHKPQNWPWQKLAIQTGHVWMASFEHGHLSGGEMAIPNMASFSTMASLGMMASFAKHGQFLAMASFVACQDWP